MVIDVAFLIIEEGAPTVPSMTELLDNGLKISVQKENVRSVQDTTCLQWKILLISRMEARSNLVCVWCWVRAKNISSDIRPSASNGIVLGHTSCEGYEPYWNGQGRFSEKRYVGKIYKETSFPPYGSSMSVGTEPLAFKHRVQVDNLSWNSLPVIRLVGEAAQLSATISLLNQSIKDIWREAMICGHFSSSILLITLWSNRDQHTHLKKWRRP